MALCCFYRFRDDKQLHSFPNLRPFPVPGGTEISTWTTLDGDEARDAAMRASILDELARAGGRGPQPP